MAEHKAEHSDSSRAASPNGETGGEKKTSATQIRKAQNRIAQREFRLRKQQYIRDLEARVEILSGDKEERIELMLVLVRSLLQENKDLRNMLKSMAAFFGDGLGSCLPRLGLTPAQLDAILTRADTDTAYEAFVTLKASKEAGAKNPQGHLSKKAARGPMPHFPPSAENAPKRKRSSKDDDDDEEWDLSGIGTLGSSSHEGEKRQRTGVTASPLNELSDLFSRPGEWDFLFPDPNSMPVAGPGPSTMAQGAAQGVAQGAAQEVDSGGFPVRMGGAGPVIGSGDGSGIPPPTNPALIAAQAAQSLAGSAPLTSSPPTSSGHEAGTPDAEHQRSLRAAVAHLTSSAVETATSPQIVTNPNNMTTAQVEERRRLQEQLRKSMEGEEATERKTEALQLITYHLNNFRINHEYKLPPSLMPTTVQRTMPHEHAIDGILFPSVRDRMILLRGRYSLVEAFHAYITEFTLHGDDALDHRNYEASERWLRDFGLLADEEVYTITNRWRAQRGDPPLHPPEKIEQQLSRASGLGTGAGIATEFLNAQ